MRIVLQYMNSESLRLTVTVLMAFIGSQRACGL